jgi:hypothetical protein
LNIVCEFVTLWFFFYGKYPVVSEHASTNCCTFGYRDSHMWIAQTTIKMMLIPMQNNYFLDCKWYPYQFWNMVLMLTFTYVAVPRVRSSCFRFGKQNAIVWSFSYCQRSSQHSAPRPKISVKNVFLVDVAEKMISLT